MPARFTKDMILALLGGLCVVAGLISNPWIVAHWFVADGVLEAGKRNAVWLFGVILVAGGFGTIVLRRRITALLDAIRIHDGDNTLRNICVAGVVLRIVVHVFLQPQNNDPHMAFVEFIVEHGRLPYVHEQILGFHPPLYFLLGAAMLAIGGTAKFVQLLSLVLSVVNLILIYRLVRSTRLLRDYGARCHALMIAAVLPQFVVFSGFCSNDALSYPLGTLLIVQVFRYIDRPTSVNLAALGAIEGIGLLTKGTFLAGLPVIGCVIIACGLRHKVSRLRHVAAAALFSVFALGLGSYKFVENTIFFGVPIVSNDQIHQGWIDKHAGTWQGMSTLLDVNVAKLVRDPLLGEHTKHSLPLLYYGTFWFSHIKESNFTATRQMPLRPVPRLLYLLGVLPTLLMLVMVVRWSWRNRWPPGILSSSDDEFRRRMQQLVLLLLLLLNLATVTSWGLKHDGWSFFQARLVFPFFFSVAILFGAGVEWICSWLPRWQLVVHAWLVALYALFGAYYVIEIGYQIVF